jgi:hypothetical protein
MRGLCGQVNDQYYLDFHVKSDGVKLSHPKEIVRGAKNLTRGQFFNIEEQELDSTALIEYVDFINRVELSLSENKAFPKARVFVKLANPDRFHVSEFFVTGYFDFKEINVVSKKKVISGKLINESVLTKKINIVDRLFIEKIGEPLVKVSMIQTSFGEIQQLRNRSNIEI